MEKLSERLRCDIRCALPIKTMTKEEADEISKKVYTAVMHAGATVR